MQAKTKGLQSGVDIGVKYSEKQERNFDDATMKAGQCVIGLQVRLCWGACPGWTWPGQGGRGQPGGGASLGGGSGQQRRVEQA